MESAVLLDQSNFVFNETKFKELEKRNIEMEASIRYAGNLQQSILPNERLFKNCFADAFVMFQPKDIVSGDFYWFFQHNSDVYFAVGDCTGHGIPGALVNIAGNTILRQIIRTEGVTDPAQILSLLDSELTSLFNENRTVGETRDGMDIAFCKFNMNTRKGYFCGAGRPLCLVRDGELIEFEKGMDAIGFNGGLPKNFQSVEIDLQRGDKFYLFTDGYTDQFGGSNIKKFNRSRFRKLLTYLAEEVMDEQKKQLIETHRNWRGTQEQIDDVCVLGIEI
jgi:serine phosphatase RsbU (regulator of sigma subunit)